jgi:choline dehydrogenase-like flavoprotein
MSDPVERGREIGAPLYAKADVVVVGSGAGGAVVARELARDGRSVIVLEEGGHYTPDEYGAMSPSHSLRRLAREAGLCAAVGIGDTPLISVMAGKCVGGSSVLTGGVCFRIPEEVLHHWSHDLGLARMTPEGLDPYFTEVENAIHVETVPESMRSKGTQLFVEGGPSSASRSRASAATRTTAAAPRGATSVARTAPR